MSDSAPRELTLTIPYAVYLTLKFQALEQHMDIETYAEKCLEVGLVVVRQAEPSK